MNYFAYRSTGLAIRAVTELSKARIRIHGRGNVPQGGSIFVANHFTRLETLFLSDQVFHLSGKKPVWSLAAATLFDSAMGRFLDAMGTVSTKNPDRDRLIVKSLLSGEASWIIYPEGRMVKNKKIIEKGRFVISFAGGKYPPHTGAATLALRTEFYRQRLRIISQKHPEEAQRLLSLFEIDTMASILNRSIPIVPLNITYYPIRARENHLNRLLDLFIEDIPDRLDEEIMTEATMMLSGVDIDIRFGEPIDISKYTNSKKILKDIKLVRPFDFDDPISSRNKMRREALKIMHRYMADIYRMTTVNPDHLFASMLRLMLFNDINIHDLRRRFFLAAVDSVKNTGIFRHPSLNGDHLDLLTDDRFSRFSDFLRLAQEKGILKKNDDKLLIRKDKISPSFSNSLKKWHRSRIDNPIAVIANEAEPLTGLQRRLRRIARLPSMWVKHRVAGMLIKNAADEFQIDYNKFYVAEESKEQRIGRPYLLKGRSRQKGIVVAHGYMAAPYEVKALAEYLNRKGFWVFVPRIKGHGTSPEDLATRTHRDWIKSMDQGYAVMSSICRRVVLGGFSNGAGLALDAAARITDVLGVFAICPPMKLHNYSTKVAPVLDLWNQLMSKAGKEAAKKEFVENNPESPRINYHRNPIVGVRELERLMRNLEPKLKKITSPAMVIQSISDPVVDERGARKVFDLLGAENKRYILFNFDRHGIILGPGAEWVHRSVGRFIDDLD